MGGTELRVNRLTTGFWGQSMVQVMDICIDHFKSSDTHQPSRFQQPWPRTSLRKVSCVFRMHRIVSFACRRCLRNKMRTLCRPNGLSLNQAVSRSCMMPLWLAKTRSAYCSSKCSWSLSLRASNRWTVSQRRHLLSRCTSNNYKVRLTLPLRPQI